MAAGAKNLFGYQQLSKVPTVGAPKLPVSQSLGSGSLLPSGMTSTDVSLGGVTQPGRSSNFFGSSTPSIFSSSGKALPYDPYIPDFLNRDDLLYPVEQGSLGSAVSSPSYESPVFTEDEVKKIAAERKKQEKINQDKMNKMMELATMGDDRQATAPRPQMVGAGSGMRNFQPIASGPLKRPDDILNTPFLQGLYS